MRKNKKLSIDWTEAEIEERAAELADLKYSDASPMEALGWNSSGYGRGYAEYEHPEWHAGWLAYVIWSENGRRT